jgi:hypothetical protein
MIAGVKLAEKRATARAGHNQIFMKPLLNNPIRFCILPTAYQASIEFRPPSPETMQQLLPELNQRHGIVPEVPGAKYLSSTNPGCAQITFWGPNMDLLLHALVAWSDGQDTRHLWNRCSQLVRLSLHMSGRRVQPPPPAPWIALGPERGLFDLPAVQQRIICRFARGLAAAVFVWSAQRN